MLRKFQAVLCLVCTLGYVHAATVSIGTISARGEMRVDGYRVKGNATLFDGSTIETAQATADLRVNQGSQITMGTNSRGTLHRDHMVLQQGQTELQAGAPYQLQASGLRISSISLNTHGVVAIKAGNLVEVSALAGNFGVTTDDGAIVATVRAGRTLLFAVPKAGNPPPQAGQAMEIWLTGVVETENGHYFITDPTTSVKYEVVGKDIAKHVGHKVNVRGTLQPGRHGGTPVINATSLEVNGGGSGGGGAVAGGMGGLSTTTKIVLISFIAAAGTGTAVGIYEANQSGTPASR